jgi:hypothetical protein
MIPIGDTHSGIGICLSHSVQHQLVRVDSVQPDGLAAAAGLLPGDIIWSIAEIWLPGGVPGTVMEAYKAIRQASIAPSGFGRQAHELSRLRPENLPGEGARWSEALGFGGGLPRPATDDDATWGGASAVSYSSAALGHMQLDTLLWDGSEPEVPDPRPEPEPEPEPEPDAVAGLGEGAFDLEDSDEELERLQQARDAGLDSAVAAGPPPRHLSVGATAFRPGGGASIEW